MINPTNFSMIPLSYTRLVNMTEYCHNLYIKETYTNYVFMPFLAIGFLIIIILKSGIYERLNIDNKEFYTNILGYISDVFIFSGFIIYLIIWYKLIWL